MLMRFRKQSEAQANDSGASPCSAERRESEGQRRGRRRNVRLFFERVVIPELKEELNVFDF